MQLAGDLELCRLREQMVEWNHLAFVVERRHRVDFAGRDIYDPVAMHRDIGADDIQRPTCHDGLDSRIEHAVLVSKLEATIRRQRSSLPNVGEPHRDSAHELTAPIYAMIHDR